MESLSWNWFEGLNGLFSDPGDGVTRPMYLELEN